MKKLSALMFAAACMTAQPALAPLAHAQALNAQEADIRAFIQDVAKQTGRTFIVDPRVKGTVSVFSTDTLTEAELFEVFLATLRANGLAAIPTATGAYRITPEEGVAQQPGGGANGGFTTQVIKLKHVDAASVAETLRPLVGRQGQVLANARSNTIVLADYADNLRRLRGLIGELDQDRATTRAIALRNSSASEMAKVAQQLLKGDEAAGVLTIVPVASSNSVILRGDPAAVERMAPILEDLDRRAESQADVRVMFLRHANADEVVPVLQEIVGQITAGKPGAEGGEGAAPRRATISRYTGANALVISADLETQRTLSDVVRQLDQRPRQVLVEAVVVEISDNAAKELGVQFLFSGTGGDSALPFVATNYSDSAPNLLATSGAILTRGGQDDDTGIGETLTEAALGSLLGANGILFGGGGQINDDALFGVIVNAVKRDSDSNILSTPSVMTLDNKSANILVGQEVPITTSEQLREGTTNPFRTVQRQDVGVQLEVKPQINEGGQITLNIRQEVSTVVGSITTDFTDVVLDKREIETTVIVDDGEIVALGGLLDDTSQDTATKVPILGDVPVVGALFRSKGATRQKRNLMVFIRPRIVNDAEDAANLAQFRLDEMRQAQIANSRSGQASLDAIVERFLAEEKAMKAAAATRATEVSGAAP